LEKRAAGQNDQQSLFPKFPGDDKEISEFEQEVQEDKQELPEEVQPGTTENVIGEKEKFVQPETEIVEDKETFEQEVPPPQSGNDRGRGSNFGQSSGFEESPGYGKKGQWFGKEKEKEEENNEIEVTTKRPWYKKVHGFFRDQYDYVKNKLRFSRGDEDFYVNS
jgi:hypothetical protein